MGAQAALVIPDQLLGGQPSGTLHIGPLDLTNIQRRVQGCSDIVQNIGA